MRPNNFHKKTKGLTIVLMLFVFSFSLSQTTTRDIYISKHLLTSLRLPEPLIDVIQPIKGAITIKPAIGKKKTILVLKAATNKKVKTNLLIFTENYEFNFVVYMNYGKHDPIVLINSQNIKDTEATQIVTSGSTSSSKVSPKKTYSLDSLQAYSSELLNPTSNAVSKVNSSVTFGLDNIFYYKGKILFKFSLFNKSKVPFDIQSIKISYTETEGIAFVTKEEIKNVSLFPFNISYTKNSKKTLPDSISHILYTVDKVGVKDGGNFEIALKEKDGNRHFQLSSKSIIGRLNNK